MDREDSDVDSLIGPLSRVSLGGRRNANGRSIFDIAGIEGVAFRAEYDRRVVRWVAVDAAPPIREVYTEKQWSVRELGKFVLCWLVCFVFGRLLGWDSEAVGDDEAEEMEEHEWLRRHGRGLGAVYNEPPDPDPDFDPDSSLRVLLSIELRARMFWRALEADEQKRYAILLREYWDVQRKFHQAERRWKAFQRTEPFPFGSKVLEAKYRDWEDCQKGFLEMSRDTAKWADCEKSWELFMDLKTMEKKMKDVKTNADKRIAEQIRAMMRSNDQQERMRKEQREETSRTTGEAMGTSSRNNIVLKAPTPPSHGLFPQIIKDYGSFQQWLHCLGALTAGVFRFREALPSKLFEYMQLHNGSLPHITLPNDIFKAQVVFHNPWKIFLTTIGALGPLRLLKPRYKRPSRAGNAWALLPRCRKRDFADYSIGEIFEPYFAPSVARKQVNYARRDTSKLGSRLYAIPKTSNRPLPFVILPKNGKKRSFENDPSTESYNLLCGQPAVKKHKLGMAKDLGYEKHPSSFEDLERLPKKWAKSNDGLRFKPA